MKFTLSWLKEHLETTATLDAIVDAMTRGGLEVEEVVDPAAKLAPFTAARVVEAVQHPNADKLRVCQVDTKDGRKEIVCGAPNARAGLVTAYAAIGTYVPGTGITLEARPVRGVVSNGMLCSGAELEIGADGDGILELPDAVAVGTPVAAVLGLDDPVIDFEVTPNRPDWLGVAGIARDLAAIGAGRLLERAAPGFATAGGAGLSVRIEAAQACPIFTLRRIRGVKNGPSPAWLRQRLEAIGLRPRSALVDVTNFFAYDRARPLHVFDAAKVRGDVTIRLARDGETLAALDGEDYALTPDMCVIADDTGVISLGGVIGGASTGASEATVDVLLESAWFDPTMIWRTGRALGIGSDAQYRFARGVDPEAVQEGLDRATAMILDLCGGEASNAIVAGPGVAQAAAFSFDPNRVKTRAGLDVPLERVKAILADLGFVATPAKRGKALTVHPPGFRRDVTAPDDLVEEIARVHGYDHLPILEPPRAPGLRSPPVSAGEARGRMARRALASVGYLEAISWSFCARAHAELFGGGAMALVLANPIASDLDCMRPTPLPNLLRAAQKNLDRGHGDARLFEVGPAYQGDGEADQRRVVAAVRQPRPARHWRPSPPGDLYEIKRDCLFALEAVGAPTAALQPAGPDAPWQHPGRSGGLKLGPRVVARFGEVHPRILQGLDVDGPALAFEIDLDALPEPKAKPTRAKPPLEKRDLMPLSRDFAFVVDEAAAAADLVRAAYGADKALIADVRVFDVYRGPGLAEGKKSLAIEVILQPKDKTLTDAEIEALSTKLIAAVAKATGGVLRG